MISKTGKAGLIGGMDIPSVSKVFRGFKLGAESVNPDFEIMICYVGSWEDVNAAYEATLAQIKRGADVVFANADQASLGTIKAAVDENVWCFGESTDMSKLAPDNLIASIIFDTETAFLRVAQKVREGKFEGGKIQELGLKDGVTYLIWNEKIKKQLPQEVIEAVNKAKERIKSGELRIPGEQEL